MGGFFTYGQWHTPSPFFHNGWVLSPSYFMQFYDNEILEGNAVKNYVGGAAAAESEKLGADVGGGPTANSSIWRWQFNGGSVGVITQTAGGAFKSIPSTAFLTFRRNIVRNGGAIIIGGSHETSETCNAPSPTQPTPVCSQPLGYHMVVEGNRVSDSPACVLVNTFFRTITQRNNICPTAGSEEKATR